MKNADWLCRAAVMALAAVCLQAGAATNEWPFAILRCYGSYAANREFIDRVFAAQERHPGLFEEIWFGGLGNLFTEPEKAGPKAAAANLAARERCRRLGIAFSLPICWGFRKWRSYEETAVDGNAGAGCRCGGEGGSRHVHGPDLEH